MAGGKHNKPNLSREKETRGHGKPQSMDWHAGRQAQEAEEYLGPYKTVARVGGGIGLV